MLSLIPLTALLFGAPLGDSSAPRPVRVLIVDGRSNHDWRRTTEATRATLEASGRFLVSVATSPPEGADAAVWEAWRPDFGAHDVVLSHYNDGGSTSWSAATRDAFEAFVRGGGGFVAIHAADNASSDWPAYDRMIGVGGWGGRTAADGSQLRRVDGAWRPVAAPDGDSGAHGPVEEFVVEHQVPEHPILAGLPTRWRHAADELYDSLRGPCEDVRVLAAAHSARTGRLEPVWMTVGYGEGRVVHGTLGHVWPSASESPVDLAALHCVGFQALLARSCEWAATGAVTLDVPAAFPDEASSRVVAPERLDWGPPAGAGREWRPLFNGRDLEGWTPKIRGLPLGENVGDTFRVEAGVLRVAYDGYESFGGRFGHLFYDAPFSRYRLRVEYRFVGEQLPDGPGWAWRNSGVMVHGQPPESMGLEQEFPVSIEVQFLGEDDGDARPTANLCTPGTHVEMAGELVTRHCTNAAAPTFRGDRWVTVEVEVLGNERVRHIVDGEVVLAYEHPQLDPQDADARAWLERRAAGGGLLLDAGTISLQSESHGIEFRRVELLDLSR